MLRLIVIALIFMNLTLFLSCTFEEKTRQYISGLPKNYEEVSNLLKENYKDATEIWKDICKKSKPLSLDNAKKVQNRPKSFGVSYSSFGKINSNIDNFLLRKMVHGSPASAKKPKKFGGKLVKFLYENKYFALLISIVFLALSIGTNSAESTASSVIAYFLIIIPVVISIILIIKMVKIEKKHYRDSGIAEIIMNYFKKSLDFIL